MGFGDWTIEIRNDGNNLFYSGQIISGTLFINQDKQKSFRGIYMEFQGCCDIIYDGYVAMHEEYFNQREYLIGSTYGKNTLQPGKHEYPFQLCLPPNCPSSFKGKYGHIQYKLLLVVDRALKKNQEKSFEIQVIAPLDLNTLPDVKNPVHMQLEKSYSVWCCPTGYVKLDVKLPTSGFCPEQAIPVRIDYDNVGSRVFGPIDFTLLKRTCYYKKSKFKEELEKLMGWSIGEQVQGWSQATVHCTLDISPFVPLNLRHCNFIHVEYYLQVALGSCMVVHPIVIGTVPLHDARSSVQIPQQNVPVTNHPSPPLCPASGAPYLAVSPHPEPNFPRNNLYPELESSYPYNPQYVGEACSPYNPYPQPYSNSPPFSPSAPSAPEN